MLLCKVCTYNKITSLTKEMFIYGEIDKIELPVRLCVYRGVRIFIGSGYFKLFQQWSVWKRNYVWRTMSVRRVCQKSDYTRQALIRFISIIWECHYYGRTFTFHWHCTNSYRAKYNKINSYSSEQERRRTFLKNHL